MGKCFFLFFDSLSGQDRFKTICCEYPLAFPWVSTAHFWSANTISCPLNRLTFSLRSLCTNGQIPHLPWLGVKFPTPAAVLKSNFVFPGKGRVSNAREEMLGLQIDRRIIQANILVLSEVLKSCDWVLKSCDWVLFLKKSQIYSQAA